MPEARSAAILTALPLQGMAHRAGRLDLGIVGLSLLVGASSSMGFIQLLAAPLENLPTSSVQVLAVQTEAFLAPLLVSLLLLLRQAPLLVTLGARLSCRPEAQRWRLWLREWWGLTLTALALVPYLMAGALVAVMLTRPELNSLEELRYLVGQLSPAMLLVSLVKSALFAAVILWISLDVGGQALAHRTAGQQRPVAHDRPVDRRGADHRPGLGAAPGTQCRWRGGLNHGGTQQPRQGPSPVRKPRTAHRQCDPAEPVDRRDGHTPRLVDPESPPEL